MFARVFVSSSLVVVGCALAGCGDDKAPPAKSAAQSAATPQLERFFAGAPLDGAVTVLAAKAAPSAGAEVTVSGRVKDLVDGVAVFTLVDATLKACGEDGEDDCSTPWDYCCHDPQELAQATITVELRDGATPIAAPLAGVHGIDHLKPVVVRGTLSTDTHGNATLVASAIRTL